VFAAVLVKETLVDDIAVNLKVASLARLKIRAELRDGRGSRCIFRQFGPSGASVSVSAEKTGHVHVVERVKI
jgi:hypothetical protein